MEEVTPESLALLHLIKPVPDLLIYGSGSKRGLPPTGTQLALQSLSIGLEALPTVRFHMWHVATTTDHRCCMFTLS